MKKSKSKNKKESTPELKILSSLNESINKTEEVLENTNNIGRIFFRGIVSGIGFTIGATVIASLLLGIFWRVFPGFQSLPMFEVGREIMNSNQN